MTKIDFKKAFKNEYAPKAKAPSVIEVPPMNYLMIDGEGYPEENQTWTDSIEALYPLAFGLKFMFKKKTPPADYYDYVVPPLEGLWWLAKGDPDFYLQNKEDWRWTMMIRQPDFITAQMVEEKIEELKIKKRLPALDKVRFERMNEGLVVQIMHIGPFSEEPATLEVLHGFIRDNGYDFRAKHHEIYLSDPRRANPEKMKTVLRQPISKK
ncbi:MAG: GyrI-like domain-containing protein [Saprospiraceae bacterium]|nr:GyrI-like domain-containing protein [Saprospiraceae bacterium]